MATAEIHSVQSISGNQPAIRRIIEEALQTFVSGVPVSIAAGDGGIKEWDGVTITDGIAGFSKEAGNNLAALGTLPTTSVPGVQPSAGSVPFQSSAVSITRPFFRDGRIGFEVATPDTIFAGQVGPAQTAVAADVGKQFGMTKDADGHWFVDRNKNTVGVNTVVTVQRLDPNDQSATPRGVYFTINAGAQQLNG